MGNILNFLVLGLGLGAVFAGVGVGVTVTYEGTGVINFAVAAVATLPVYIYATLQDSGRLQLPLPGNIGVHIGNLGEVGSILISLVFAAILGALAHFLVFHPLRKAPVLARIVASVGILSVVSAAAGLGYGTNAIPVGEALPVEKVHVLGVDIPLTRLWLTAATTIVVLAIWMWLRKGRTGLAIRAAAENERTAAFARLSPPRLALITWMLASVVTSLVFILAGSAVSPLTPTDTTLLIVPGLAAALVGRLRSLPLTLLAGLVLGVLESELTYVSNLYTWWPSWAHQGLTDAVPFLAIVIALVALGRSIPTRGEDMRDPLPPVRVPRNRPSMVFGLAGLGVVLLMVTHGTLRFGIVAGLASALIALSLVLLVGMVGQVTLAQGAFAGLSAFMLMKFGTGIPFPLSLLIAVAASGLLGVLVGLPALRVRGNQLAVITLAASLVLSDFIFNNSSLETVNTTLPAPKLFGFDLGNEGSQSIARIQFAILALVLTVLTFIVVGNIMRAGSGRRFLAIRSNEKAATSVGINVASAKLSAFAISSCVAGLGGALLSYAYGSFSSGSFDVLAGLNFLAIAYIGGITSLSGSLTAGTAVQLGVGYVIINHLVNLGTYYDLFAGIGLILTVVFNPMGIAGKTRENLDHVLARLGSRRGAKPADGRAEGVGYAGVTPVVGAGHGKSTSSEIGPIAMEASEISVSYGGVRALQDVTIEVREGEIVGLIGPNGSGKTSFIDGITGFTPARGRVTLNGTALQDLPAYQRARVGLVRTWQSVELFQDLPTADNVLSTAPSTWWSIFKDVIRPGKRDRDARAVAEEYPYLADVVNRRPSELSLGHQKMLGLARALSMSPRCLLLDEPAAGLDTSESVAFGDYLRDIANHGMPCLLIDHDMAFVMSICDRIYVLNFGQVIAHGSPEEVSNDPIVREAYLGSGHMTLADEYEPSAPNGTERLVGSAQQAGEISL